MIDGCHTLSPAPKGWMVLPGEGAASRALG